MSEKLTESITFKCTYEEKRNLEAIAKSENKTLSEHIRSLGMSNISEVRERLNNLASLMRLTTDTVDTSFELQAPPLSMSHQNPQAQKKSNRATSWTFLPFLRRSKRLGWNPMTNLTRIKSQLKDQKPKFIETELGTKSSVLSVRNTGLWMLSFGLRIKGNLKDGSKSTCYEAACKSCYYIRYKPHLQQRAKKDIRSYHERGCGS